MTSPAKTIDVRGTMLGSDTPVTCTPLVGRTRERVLAEASAVVAKNPDTIEWRVDFFGEIADTRMVLDTAAALRQIVGPRPIIFTRRSNREGGEPIPIGDADVVRLYDAVGESGLVDFVDFEMANDPEHVHAVVSRARAHGTRVVLSYHNFSYTPGVELLVQRFMEGERLGGDVAKVAVMPRDRLDVLALLQATAIADAKARIPLISMSMGPLGAVTRMVGGLFGSALSFAVGEGAPAPGQMPIADLERVFHVIARARGASR